MDHFLVAWLVPRVYDVSVLSTDDVSVVMPKSLTYSRFTEVMDCTPYPEDKIAGVKVVDRHVFGVEQIDLLHAGASGGDHVVQATLERHPVVGAVEKVPGVALVGQDDGVVE
jgi:hypothetical protein